MATLYQIALEDLQIERMVGGPAFTRHSKTSSGFSSADRKFEQEDGARLHTDEIEKVAV